VYHSSSSHAIPDATHHLNMMWCRIQLDVGVHPDVLADIMGAMREHSDLYPTEYEGPPFVQVCGICLWH
jgi:hypothetical protein